MAIHRRLSHCHSLERLILSGNGIRTIPPFSSAPSPLQGIKSLSLSRNDLEQWRCIDALHAWCPNLESLRMIGNPLTEGTLNTVVL